MNGVVDLLSNDDKERHDAHDGNDDLSKGQIRDSINVEPLSIADCRDPDIVAKDASHQVHEDNEGTSI